MSQYEYTVIQSAAGARISLMNERIETLVADGWEPVLMSGDATVSILFRRPRRQAAAQQAHAQSAVAAAPRPAAVAPSSTTPPVQRVNPAGGQ